MGGGKGGRGATPPEMIRSKSTRRGVLALNGRPKMRSPNRERLRALHVLRRVINERASAIDLLPERVNSNDRRCGFEWWYVFQNAWSQHRQEEESLALGKECGCSRKERWMACSACLCLCGASGLCDDFKGPHSTVVRLHRRAAGLVR